MPARVLVLNERDPRHPKAGGAEIHLAELAPRLQQRGFQLTQLACRFPGAAEREQVAGLQVRRLGALPFYYPRAAAACARETRAGHFDLVLEVLCKLPFYSPLYAARPVLCVCHHLFGRTAFRQVPWPVAATVYAAEGGIARFYRRPPFVVGSASTRDDLVQRGIAAERIRIIPYGTHQPGAAAPPGHAKRVAYVGRLERYKQVDLLLRAVARLSESHPDAEIAIVGRGAERPRLERLARDLGLAGRTRFTGFVGDAERDALLASARLCVYPSQKEGFGLSVIEANALGVPVVATDAPGLRDSVRPGETGFLVADGDVAGFAAAIAALLDDDALHERMSRASRAWSRRFDWDLAADALAESLDRLRRCA